MKEKLGIPSDLDLEEYGYNKETLKKEVRD